MFLDRYKEKLFYLMAISALLQALILREFGYGHLLSTLFFFVGILSTIVGLGLGIVRMIKKMIDQINDMDDEGML